MPLDDQPHFLRSPLAEKLAIALAMGLVLGVGFYYVDFRNADRVQRGAEAWITEIAALDDRIPFDPRWVWPYLSYFLLCFLPLAFCGDLQRFRRIAASYVLVYVPSILFFWAVPSRMIRPEIEGTGAAAAAVRWLYAIDPGFNVFPSLHTANAVLVGWIFRRYAPAWAPLVWLWAGAVVASTVLVKQHYVIDLPAGLALGTAAYFLVFGR